MPDWSRRHALQAAASVGTLALAGCNGGTDRSRSLPPDRDRVTEYETAFARNEDGEPVFVTGETGTAEEGGPDEERRQRVGAVEHVTDDADLDDLRFRDVPGAADLESFLRATDLESRSVYLLQRPIGECYAVRLVGVFREDDGVEADFCRMLRPADVSCAADAEDVYAVAIRLPFPGDDFSGLGTGMSGDCEGRSSVPLTEGGDGA
jgi:hypothetical protein